MKRALGSVMLVAVLSAVAIIWLRTPRPKPGTSLLVIVVDSMRADHIDAYGYPRATTPRIDALSHAGVTFDKAYTQAPWTKPSVASIFTSTYISVHRVLYSKEAIEGKIRSDVLNGKFLTLAEAMKAGGYATAGFGQKIHLHPEFGFDQGFQAYDMHAGRAEGLDTTADPGETLPLQDRDPKVVKDLRGRLEARATANLELYDRIKPESTTPLDPETEERLRSLGYVG